MEIGKSSKFGGEIIPLAKFDSEDAFNLGMIARRKAKEYGEHAVIGISSADGHCLFHCSTSCFTSAANDIRLEAKRKYTTRLRKSELKDSGDFLKESMFLEQKPYKSREERIINISPGAIPIFLYNGDFPLGCIAVDSLAGRDEELAESALKELALKQKAEKEEKEKQERYKLVNRLKDEQEQEIARQVEEKLKVSESPQKLEGNAWTLYNT